MGAAFLGSPPSTFDPMTEKQQSDFVALARILFWGFVLLLVVGILMYADCRFMEGRTQIQCEDQARAFQFIVRMIGRVVPDANE